MRYFDLHSQRLHHLTLSATWGWELASGFTLQQKTSPESLSAVTEFHRAFDDLLFNNTRPLIRAAPTRLPFAFYFCKYSPCEQHWWWRAWRWATGKCIHIQTRFIYFATIYFTLLSLMLLLPLIYHFTPTLWNPQIAALHDISVLYLPSYLSLAKS